MVKKLKLLHRQGMVKKLKLLHRQGMVKKHELVYIKIDSRSKSNVIV